MVEPTESEGQAELDRFCDAMIAIRDEIRRVGEGEWPAGDNPLHNAPHPALDVVVDDEWTHPYSRREAAYPLRSIEARKYWPPVSRIDQVYGDRNLVCACPPLEAYED
jgi:glycine dehydrogenase